MDASCTAYLRNGKGILNMGWEDHLPQSVFDKCQLREGLNATVLLVSLFGSNGSEWLHLCVPDYLSVAVACSTWDPAWFSFMRVDSISKGCACNTVLLTPCYQCSSPVHRVVVLGLRGFLFLALCTYFLPPWSYSCMYFDKRQHEKILCGLLNFFVQCGPQNFLQINVPTVIYTKKSCWQNRLQVRLSEMLKSILLPCLLLPFPFPLKDYSLKCLNCLCAWALEIAK